MRINQIVRAAIVVAFVVIFFPLVLPKRFSPFSASAQPAVNAECTVPPYCFDPADRYPELVGFALAAYTSRDEMLSVYFHLTDHQKETAKLITLRNRGGVLHYGVIYRYRIGDPIAGPFDIYSLYDRLSICTYDERFYIASTGDTKYPYIAIVEHAVLFPPEGAR